MRTRLLAERSLAIGIAVFVVSLARAQDLIDRGVPGVLLCFYELDESPHYLPDLAPDQLPNVARVARTIDLDGNRGDFAPLDSPFMTEATGYIHTTIPGEYAFRLVSDDGARLWIDGNLVIDHDGLHGPDPKDGAVELSAGTHELRVGHFDAGGGQRLALMWKPPSTGEAADFVTVPAGALTHKATPALETSAGKKRIIPPLRRGRPGDGSPVSGTHPAFRTALESDRISGAGNYLRKGEYVVRGGRTSHVPVRIWIPDCGPADGSPCFALSHPMYPGQQQVYASIGNWRRVYMDELDGVQQGCVFRFSSSSEPLVANPGQITFEMLSVRALSNGLEITFTKPLDARCGWEPDSYYVEQWPFDLEEQHGPQRDGSTVPVKSASVSPDRQKVFLEIEGLKPSHVVYIRLLPPCFAEDGQLPWSTEAWYTLNAIPRDRTGQILPAPPKPPQNVLTDAERQAGWKLLFDGKTGAGWHGWKKQEFPAGWQIIDGCLVRAAPAGDIATDQEFDNFELALEWRISAGGNSGIFFRSDESLRWPWESGPEMQVLDNAEHADGRNPKTSAGSNYALYAPVRDVTRPVGLFNEVRIVVDGAHVEHWLNGEKIIEYELGSPQWQELVAASKFKDMPKYGRVARGHIVLQDHGDKVWYRNIKIRPLP
jgi:hypothetical protein